MTSADTTTDPASADARPTAPGPSWWRELLLAGVFYAVYSFIRNLFGAGPESRTIAFEHAKDVIAIEEAVGLWFEPQLQRWYLSLPADGFIWGWNVFYGTAHFVVTMWVLVTAFQRAPGRYRFLRTMLAGTTALALIGFASFTLMPPRLLDADSPYGACYQLGADCHGYNIVDTIDVWGGIWKFGEGGMATISNQYAAMPSLHFAWSTWCAMTMVLVIGHGRRRWLWFLYPAMTTFCVLVTGNHYWLDAAFGGLALAGGFAIAVVAERITDRARSPEARGRRWWPGSA